MKVLNRLFIVSCLLLSGLTNAMAQANYWNIGGTYFNCTTGAVATTTPTVPTDVYADAFFIPGICDAYYRVSWIDTWGPPHGNALLITDISPNTSGHPFNGSGDQYYLINDGYAHQGASVAVAPLAANKTRKIYATYDNLIQSWTINADGTVSGPSTLYTYPSGAQFDSRTVSEVSADGKYLLINKLASPGGAVIVFDLSNNTPTNYPSPAGSVTGFEYVTGWSATPRIYVSYNNMWFNPSGASGFGYYTLGNTSSFTNITTPPSGTDIRGFGFTDIEKAKDGKLYMVYNPTLSTSISNNGTLYSYSSTGVWAAVSGITVPATYNNWGYAVQVQIDGENYDNGYYATPLVTFVGMNGISGGATPATAPTIFRCPGSAVILNADYTGTLTYKFFSVTLGTISGGTFTPNPPPVSYPYGESGSSDTFAKPLSVINATVGNYTGAFMIEAFSDGPCGNQMSLLRYFIVQDVSVLAAYSKPGCISSGFPCAKPIQTTLPITTTPPASSSSIATFRSNVDAAPGYMGAGNCGMFGINTNGTWTVSVYEVEDTTGTRKIIGADTAPNIAYFTGTGARSGVTYFNQNAYAFDENNPPFYVDTTSNYGDGPYFSDFYSWARFDGSLTTDYGKRIFCADLTVTDTISGCTVSNRSFFKIAVNGTYSNGSNAKPGAGDDEGEGTTGIGNPEFGTRSLQVYPNPVSDNLNIMVPFDLADAELQITDNTGRSIRSGIHLKSGKNVVDTKTLQPGVYFYSVSLNGRILHGKIVKR